MKPTIKITTLLLFLIIIIPLTLAVEPTPIPNDPNANLKNYVTAEHIKTRTEFTQYTDRKIDELITYVTTKGQDQINENFQVLDERVRLMFLKAQIQLALNIILSIITAQAIWWFLKKKLEKIRKPRPTSIKDNLTANKYGLMSQDYQNKITQEDQTIIKPTTYHDTNETTPNTPQVDLIEEMLKEKKIKEQQQREKEQQKILEQQNKIRQQKNQELQKLKQERQKKTEKINKKIMELDLELNPMPPAPIPPPIFKQE